MFVTGRLPLLLALGAVPVVLLSIAGANAWVAAAGWLVLVLAVMGADAAAAADPRRVEVTRPDAARRALLGQLTSTTLRVRNTGGRRIRGLVRDAWQPTAGAPLGRLPLDLAAGEVRELTVPLLPRRRGELVSQFVVIRSLGPLGFAGRQARIDSRGAARVLPPFTSRRHLPSRLARLRELDGSTSVQVRGAGTEFDSLREYVRGDDVRSIDWRATARAGTTMLRTWRPERDRHIVVVIDTGRTSAARVGDGVRLDAAMEATLLLAALAARAGDHVHLVMFDRLPRARVTRVDGAALLPALVEAMAPVEPQLIDTDWDAAFAQVRALTSRPSLVVLLTAQDAPESARGFLGSLPALTARAHVLVGTATDAESSSAAGAGSGGAGSGGAGSGGAASGGAGGPSGGAASGGGSAGAARARRTVEDVYRAAAEERTARDAARVAAAVSRAGGEAIAASADDLPPRIADRYLALKAAGRL